MNRFFGVVLGMLVIGLGGVYAANPASIVQINVYEHDEIHGTYTPIQQGSAVVLDNQTVLTNAHVVTDAEDQASYHYEVCKTTVTNQPPVCFAAGYVKKLLVDRDLAVVKFPAEDGLVPVIFASSTPTLGDDVTVLGYPGNGGATITQTVGKISGFEDDYYKTDANFDAGNSGGGAFNEAGELIGIPTFVAVGYTTLGYIVPLTHINELLYDTPVLEGSSIDAMFDAYKKREYRMMHAVSMQTDGYTFSGFGKYGYTPYAYYHTNQLRGPETIQYQDARKKTMISIARYAKQGDAVWSKNGNHSMQDNAELFEISRSKQITYDGETWDLTFAAGVEGEPHFKQLSFIHRGGDDGLRYIVTSTDSKTDAFVDGILLFLKQFTVQESTHSLQGFEQLTQEVLLFGDMMDATAYGFDEYGQLEIAFLTDAKQIAPHAIEMTYHTSSEEFEEISYDEFRIYVDSLIEGSGLGEIDGVALEQSYLARNKNGLMMMIQPVAYDIDEKQFTSYTVGILLEDQKNTSVYQYSINLYSTDTTAELKQMLAFIDSLAPQGGVDHPFGEIGVSEDEIRDTSTFSFNS